MLSIIVPIYNVEKYLDKCLKSIYNLEIEKEVILVNDGSKDNSFKIIEKYKKEYDKITVVINQKNQGLSQARNNGLKVAKGEYIYFLDSDDWVDENNFLKLYNIIIENKELDMITGIAKIYIDKTGEEYFDYEIPKEYENKIYSGKDYLVMSLKNKIYTPMVPVSIYKKSFLLNKKLFFSVGKVHEDEVFILKTLKRAKKIMCFNKVIFYYRQRENSIMKSFNIKHAYDMFENIKELIEEFKDENNQDVRQMAFYKIKRYYRSVMKYALRYGDKSFYSEVLKEFKRDCKKYFFKIKHYNYDIIEVYLVYKFDKIYYGIRNFTKKFRN